MSGWDWTPGTVLAGTDVTVTVDGAPCNPVTVTLTVDGEVVDSGQVRPPGSTRLSVPAGSAGKPYVIKVACNGESDSQGGNVG
jgi:hypothetical protein